MGKENSVTAPDKYIRELSHCALLAKKGRFLLAGRSVPSGT